MQPDDTGEAEGRLQPEVRDMRNGEMGEGQSFVMRDHRGQLTERGRSTIATVNSRTEQFLVAKKSGPLPHDVQPFDLGRFEQTLKAGGIGECTHIRTLTRYGRGTLDALSAGGTEAEAIIVAEMPHDIAARLGQHPGLVVELDHLLSYAQPALAQDTLLNRDPGVLMPYGTGFTASITVMGEGGIPLEGAAVYLYGKLWQAQGMNDDRRSVNLKVFGES